MSYTYRLEYRQKGSAPWTVGGTGIPRDAATKEMTHTLAAGTLTPGQTYEFRWVRLGGDGAQTPLANSNVVEAFIDTTVTTIDGSGTVGELGTFLVNATSGGNEATLVRSATKIVLQLSANWEYVRIDNFTAPISGETQYFAKKTGTYNNPVNYPENTAIIAKVTNKIVDVKLDSTYTYRIYIKYNGNSTGTIQVNAI